MMTTACDCSRSTASEPAPTTLSSANCRVDRGPIVPENTLSRFVRKGVAARTARPSGSRPPRRAIVGNSDETRAPETPRPIAATRSSDRLREMGRRPSMESRVGRCTGHLRQARWPARAEGDRTSRDGRPVGRLDRGPALGPGLDYTRHGPRREQRAPEMTVTDESPTPPDSAPNEGMWRAILLGTDPRLARTRAMLKHIPSAPRCKMCAAPFGGLGRPLMHLVHRDRWAKNPFYCGFCFRVLEEHRGGAEIEASFLFADVRGSTSLAEGMSPTAFRRLLDRFYELASRILVDHDGIVDKFVGDEVIGLFIPALAGGAHAARAIESAQALLRATGHGDPGGPWLPIGVGVHTGVAYIGSVGEPPVTDLTALGDVVNTTARLASAAAAGETLVSEAAATSGAFDPAGLERRELELKGKRDMTPVFVVTVGQALGRNRSVE